MRILLVRVSESSTTYLWVLGRERKAQSRCEIWKWAMILCIVRIEPGMDDECNCNYHRIVFHLENNFGQYMWYLSRNNAAKAIADQSLWSLVIMI